jgi:hypothetical protein
LVMTAPGVQAGSGRAPRAWQPSCFVPGPGVDADGSGGWASATINGAVGAAGGADDDADGAGAAAEGGAALVGSDGVGGVDSGDTVEAAAGARATGDGPCPAQAATTAKAARMDATRPRMRRLYKTLRAGWAPVAVAIDVPAERAY